MQISGVRSAENIADESDSVAISPELGSGSRLHILEVSYASLRCILHKYLGLHQHDIQFTHERKPRDNGQ